MNTSTLIDSATAVRLAVAEDRARTNYSAAGLAKNDDYTVASMARYMSGLGTGSGIRFYTDEFDREQSDHYAAVAGVMAAKELERRGVTGTVIA